MRPPLKPIQESCPKTAEQSEPLRNSIPYGHQLIDENDIEAVAKILRSDFITTGPVAEQFEEDLCALTGAKHAIVCANGTAALHLACLALKVD